MKVYPVIYWNTDMTTSPEVKGVFSSKEAAVKRAQELFDDLELDEDLLDECGDVDYEDGFFHVEDDDLTVHIEVFAENVV